MTNRSKNKGTAWETAVVRYCQANGFPLAERIALHGSKDIGDIRLTAGVILECKDHATYSDGDIADWLEETWREKLNANASHATLVVKRARKNVSHAWAIHPHKDTGAPVYMYLEDALMAYRHDGYGDEF